MEGLASGTGSSPVRCNKTFCCLCVGAKKKLICFDAVMLLLLLLLSIAGVDGRGCVLLFAYSNWLMSQVLPPKCCVNVRCEQVLCSEGMWCCRWSWTAVARFAAGLESCLSGVHRASLRVDINIPIACTTTNTTAPRFLVSQPSSMSAKIEKTIQRQKERFAQPPRPSLHPLTTLESPKANTMKPTNNSA
jgi:hypothetical protein